MIRVLSEETIDKIAAGEVVERPASCIKELCENSIDAGARVINVEIKGGGISLMRVSDDGCGISAGEIETAFLRHATSKITSADDLLDLRSLGFRGEALSSIAAVSKLEMVTKTADSMVASRYTIEGGRSGEVTEVGAPGGTTIIVRDLFYNTPARRKFLKTATAEGSNVAQVMEHMALSHPEVSFSFVNNGRTILQTYGKGSLEEVIYQIYGRDIARELIRIDDGAVSGFVARPTVSRSSRGMELFFVNGRYIKTSQAVRGALEEAFAPYMMQHRFPFAVLFLSLDGSQVDANIHPQKLEVRFSDNERVYEIVRDAVSMALKEKELIPQVKPDFKTPAVKLEKKLPGEFEPLPFYNPAFDKAAGADEKRGAVAETGSEKASEAKEPSGEAFKTSYRAALPFETGRLLKESGQYEAERREEKKEEQLNLFEEKLLTRSAADEYKILGQAFDTYWIVESGERLLLIDQHAAHEKVLYERFVRQIREGGVYTQQLMPPIVVTLDAASLAAFSENEDIFKEMGFEIEEYGGHDICIRAVPENFSGINSARLFTELLDSLSESGLRGGSSEMIKDRIATMACKAAVKGGNRLSEDELKALLSEMMELENPYNCPHGRPTMIVMTKYELEKKFKRIV